MESRIRNIFLIGSLCVSPLLQAKEAVIEPDLDRREIKTADIDTEDYEIGGFAGVMNVEDFGTNPVYGIRLTYHVTEDIFVESSYARTDTNKTSYERLSGSAQLLRDDERKLEYYNLSFGWNLIPGEGFIGSDYAFTSSLYVVGGVGNSTFAGDDRFTWNIGAGYRFLPADWAAVHIEFRDHVFDIDLLGQEQTNHNLEATAGLSIFF